MTLLFSRGIALTIAALCSTSLAPAHAAPAPVSESLHMSSRSLDARGVFDFVPSVALKLQQYEQAGSPIGGSKLAGSKSSSGNSTSSSSIDLGSWTTSIASVSTESPKVDTSDVFDKVADKLWTGFWGNSSNNWNDGCGNTNTPVVWSVAVAGRAITDTRDRSKIKKAVGALDNYKSTQKEGGYSASTNKDGDIYIDDDGQVSWVLTDAYKVQSVYSYLSDAIDLQKFIESYKNDDVGGVIWSIKGNYVASISTLEAGLAAARLYQLRPNSDYLDFAKYCVQWTLTNLLDDSDKFIYDGMSTSGDINNGKLTYSIGTAISTLALLDQHDSSQNWKAMAVELAVRTIGAGNLNTIFFTNGHLNNEIRYSHLLFAGFADLLEKTSPSGSYQKSAYTAIQQTLAREARYLYDKYEDNVINGSGCSGLTTLLDVGSLAQIFYETSRVVDEI